MPSPVRTIQPELSRPTTSIATAITAIALPAGIVREPRVAGWYCVSRSVRAARSSCPPGSTTPTSRRQNLK